MRRSSAGTATRTSMVGLAAALALATCASFTVGAVGSPGEALACSHVHASTKSLSKSKARDAMRCLINGARKHRGERALGPNGDLADVAQKHTRLMRRKNCFSHQCPGEGDLLGRIRSSGYLSGVGSYSFAENIAFSSRRSSSPKSIFKAWMGSSGHRANILASQSRDIGIGLTARGGKSFWTTDFGSRG